MTLDCQSTGVVALKSKALNRACRFESGLGHWIFYSNNVTPNGMNEMIDNKTALFRISANIQHFMQMQGVSQADLVRKTGENSMNISRTCRGQNVPNIVLLARIAEALDVSVDQLLSEPAGKFSRTG